MINLRKAMDEVFGNKGMDYKDTGDQKLVGAITAFNMLRESPKNLGAIITLKRCIDDLTKFQKDANSPKLNQQVHRLKTHYNPEVKILLAASSRGRRLYVPSDREIRFLDRQ